MDVTLEEIAKLAGVNSSTVSRVINSPEMVKLKTRQKIEAIINEKGYKPNYFARGLAKGKTDSVGIITSFNKNPYMIEIIESIEYQLAMDGTFMYLCNCQHSLELEQKYLDELMHRKIDGLFVIESPSLNTKENLYLAKSYSCPVILINQHTKPYGDNFIVGCDQEPGILEVFEEVKRRKLFPFILLIPDGISYSFNLKEKLFETWRQENNLGENEARCIKLNELIDPNHEKSVWQSSEVSKEIFDRYKPRSVLAGNDLMALGVLAAARDRGISVPGQLSIAGVDNTYISRISIPAMSTVDLRMDEVGLKAAELYQSIKDSDNTNINKTLTLPSNFCFRETF